MHAQPGPLLVTRLDDYRGPRLRGGGKLIGLKRRRLGLLTHSPLLTELLCSLTRINPVKPKLIQTANIFF